MSYNHVRSLLQEGKPVLLDGAMGTEIHRRGSKLLNDG